MRKQFDTLIQAHIQLNHKELNDLYSSPIIWMIISSRMRWSEHVAHRGGNRGAYRVLVRRPEGKRPLGTQA